MIIKLKDYKPTKYSARYSVSGSEIATICGFNSQETPVELYLRKQKMTAISTELIPSEYLKYSLAESFLKLTDNKLPKGQKLFDSIGIYEFYNRLYCKPAFTYWPKGMKHNDVNKHVAMVKINDFPLTQNTMPSKWTIEMQWHMLCTGCQHCPLIYLDYKTKDIRSITKHFDVVMCEMLVKNASVFINFHIKKKEAPTELNIGDKLLLNPDFDSASSSALESTETIILEDDRELDLDQAMDYYDELTKDIQTLNNKKNDIADKVKALMIDRGCTDVHSQNHDGQERIIATFKPVSTLRTVFNESQFRKDHPDLYEEYLEKKASSPMFKCTCKFHSGIVRPSPDAYGTPLGR